MEGKRRQFAAHRERPNAVLAVSDTKLFFLLTYLKSNSLQQQASSSGISQARVSQSATAPLEVLNQVVVGCGLLPVRDGAELAQRLATHSNPVFAYDWVEQDVPRNRDYDAQAEEYSAKKRPSRKEHDAL